MFVMNLHLGFRSSAQANNETVKTAIHQERVKSPAGEGGPAWPLEAGAGAGHSGGGSQEIL